MNRPTWTSAVALAAILGAGLCVLNTASAEGEEPTPPATPAPPTAPTPPKFDPKTIWPAGLKELAGRYQFIQVASPGGLWARTGKEARQVSLNELTPAVRDRLRKAELIISDLQFDGPPEAREDISPSRRGKIRFYSESAVGNLTLHNVPGIGGDDEDKGEFTGRVTFSLNHQSHSNPSVAGVLFQRLQQESTWGVATLDFADLEAIPLVEGKAPPRRRPAPPRSTTQRPEASRVLLASTVNTPDEPAEFRLTAGQPTVPTKPAPAKPAPGKPAPGKPMPPASADDDEQIPTIANARVLRSGIEIVAFVEWQEQVKGKSTLYNGSIRLIKMDELRKLQERLGMMQRGGPASGSPAPAPGSPSSPSK